MSFVEGNYHGLPGTLEEQAQTMKWLVETYSKHVKLATQQYPRDRTALETFLQAKRTDYPSDLAEISEARIVEKAENQQIQASMAAHQFAQEGLLVQDTATAADAEEKKEGEAATPVEPAPQTNPVAIPHPAESKVSPEDQKILDARQDNYNLLLKYQDLFAVKQGWKKHLGGKEKFKLEIQVDRGLANKEKKRIEELK